MKTLNIPVYKRENYKRTKSIENTEDDKKEINTFKLNKENIILDLKTIESNTSSNDNSIFAFRKMLIESEKQIENLKNIRTEKEAIILELSLKMNMNTSKYESYFDVPRSKRNSHSSFNTVGTNIQQNSVSTLDSPMKPYLKDTQPNTFKRKRENVISEEKNLNIEISRFMKEKNSYILLAKEELEEIREDYENKERENREKEESKYKEMRDQISSEHYLLVESLNTEKIVLNKKIEKLSEEYISMEDHQIEINKMTNLNALRRKFLVEKLKYFQLLLTERKQNDVTILSKCEDHNNNYFTTTSNINNSEFNTNPQIINLNQENSLNLDKSKIVVDKSMEEFFLMCNKAEIDNKVGIIKIFSNFFKK